MKRLGLAMVAALALAGAACVTMAGAARAQVNDDPTGPQPQLPTEPLSITSDSGKVYNFTVEIAATPQQQAYGLMFRPSVAPDAGMLFPEVPAAPVQFWMKNTIVPLDIVFIGPDGKIISIAENAIPYSLKPIPSGGAVGATLELQGGITATDGISVGDMVVAKGLDGS
jgi:uncharacterized membrane protein (UPF0127 family)